MQEIEEKLAHLIRAVADHSDTEAAQQNEITTLNRRVQMLMQREAERASNADGVVHLGDERPPHW